MSDDRDAVLAREAIKGHVLIINAEKASEKDAFGRGEVMSVQGGLDSENAIHKIKIRSIDIGFSVGKDAEMMEQTE